MLSASPTERIHNKAIHHRVSLFRLPEISGHCLRWWCAPTSHPPHTPTAEDRTQSPKTQQQQNLLSLFLFCLLYVMSRCENNYKLSCLFLYFSPSSAIGGREGSELKIMKIRYGTVIHGNNGPTREHGRIEKQTCSLVGPFVTFTFISALNSIRMFLSSFLLPPPIQFSNLTQLKQRPPCPLPSSCHQQCRRHHRCSSLRMTAIA